MTNEKQQVIEDPIVDKSDLIYEEEKAMETNKLEILKDIEVPTLENNIIFNRENQDKIGLDVITTIENLLKERQLTFFKNHALIE